MKSSNNTRILFSMLAAALTAGVMSAVAQTSVKTVPVLQSAAQIRDPDAPPEGSITITAPASDAKVFVDVMFNIKWTSTGLRIPNATLTLYKDGDLAMKLAENAANGVMNCTVPASVLKGNPPVMGWFIHVTSESDPRIKASQRIWVRPGSIVFNTPQKGDKLKCGSQQEIIWNFKGKPGPIKLDLDYILLDKPVKLMSVTLAENVSPGTNGYGKTTVTLPTPLVRGEMGNTRFNLIARRMDTGYAIDSTLIFLYK